MADMERFVNTFFMAENLKNQRQQQALMEQNSLAQRMNLAANLATLMANPEGRQNLSFMVGGEENLQSEIVQALEGLAPGQGVLQRFAGMQGFQRAPQETREGQEDIAAELETTGLLPSQRGAEDFLSSLPLGQGVGEEQLASLARQREAQLAAGQTLSGVKQDTALAQYIEPEEWAQFQRIAAGTELSENQKNHWVAQALAHGLNVTEVAQRGALGVAGLLVQKYGIDQQYAAARAAGIAGDHPSPNMLMQIITDGIENAGDQSKSREERQQWIVATNNAMDILSSIRGPNGQGLYPTEVRLPWDPDDLDKKLPGLRSWLYGAAGAAGGAIGGARGGALVGGMAGPKGALIGGALGGIGGSVLGTIIGSGESAGSTVPQGFSFPEGFTMPTDPSQLLDAQGRPDQELIEAFRTLGLLPRER